jgi:hypothetical protein
MTHHGACGPTNRWVPSLVTGYIYYRLLFKRGSR